jgi:hypothetical protein
MNVLTRHEQPTFETSYPNLTRWAKEFGWLEIGYDGMTDSFIRALHPGGDFWKGRPSYRTMDEALADAEEGVARLIPEYE